MGTHPDPNAAPDSSPPASLTKASAEDHSYPGSILWLGGGAGAQRARRTVQNLLPAEVSRHNRAEEPRADGSTRRPRVECDLTYSGVPRILESTISSGR